MIDFFKFIAPHIAVFMIALVVDIFWANYNMRSSEKKPHPAAFWSMMIIVAGTFSTQIWLTNHWVLIDGAAGAYLGTWWAIRRGQRASIKNGKSEIDLLVEEGQA